MLLLKGGWALYSTSGLDSQNSYLALSHRKILRSEQLVDLRSKVKDSINVGVNQNCLTQSIFTTRKRFLFGKSHQSRNYWFNDLCLHLLLWDYTKLQLVRGQKNYSSMMFLSSKTIWKNWSLFVTSINPTYSTSITIIFAIQYRIYRKISIVISEA